MSDSFLYRRERELEREDVDEGKSRRSQGKEKEIISLLFSGKDFILYTLYR